MAGMAQPVREVEEAFDLWPTHLAGTASYNVVEAPVMIGLEGWGEFVSKESQTQAVSKSLPIPVS